MAEDLLPPERCLALGEDGRVVVHVDIDCFYAQAEEVSASFAHCSHREFGAYQP